MSPKVFLRFSRLRALSVDLAMAVAIFFFVRESSINAKLIYVVSADPCELDAFVSWVC